MNKERLSEWKSDNDYEKIVSIIKNGRLNDFVAGSDAIKNELKSILLKIG